MDFKYDSDNIRYNTIKKAMDNPVAQPHTATADALLNADDLTMVSAVRSENGSLEVYYDEMWNENCLTALFQKPEYKSFKEHGEPLEAIHKFFLNRFLMIAHKLGLQIADYDIVPTDFDNEAILHVEMVHTKDDIAEDMIISEADFYSGRQGGDPMLSSKPLPDQQVQQTPQGGRAMAPVSPDNKFNQVYLTKDRPQDPRLVDRILKTVFDSKFNAKYSLSTDVGEWHPTKTLSSPEGKFFVQWEHDQTNKVKIATTFFPDESNKIQVNVTDGAGKMLIDTYFEIYRIPTDTFLVERFLRKVYFNIMKKFINAQIIKLEPFRRSFVFWKSNNPYFSYSFSEPKKNQIILDLIGFIKTNQKPVLDDFFEQNNLRHKQGYLQTLLDAAEDAGIFEFNRQGNEVLIRRGANFKAFLEGRIRKA